MQNGEISLEDVKNNQEKFKSYLGELKQGKKSKEQKNTLHNKEAKLLNFLMVILL